jgi:molybdopterin-guanine dinucleotide biosynthesis protein B
MRRLHVIGRKNHGKTTLVAQLVEELTKRGWRVGTIKHTHHHHELDTPGKDSHRHRLAGSQVVGILSPRMNAVFWEPVPSEDVAAASDSNRDTDGRRYDDFERFMRACDLVIVEGDSQTEADKIEVWRAALNSCPIAAEQPSILALVTDDGLPAELTPARPLEESRPGPPAGNSPNSLLVFPRANLELLLNWIVDRYLGGGHPEDFR